MVPRNIHISTLLMGKKCVFLFRGNIMEQKKDLSRVVNELHSKSISMNKFLLMYCSIDVACLDGTKLSHKDVKELMPSLKRYGSSQK